MKKVKIGILTCISCVLCILVGIRFYQQVQIAEERNEKRVIYEMGEEVPLGKDTTWDVDRDGYFVTVLEAELLTSEEFCEKYNASIDDIPEFDYTPMVYDVKIRLRNENNVDGYIDMYEWPLMNNASFATADQQYYIIANKDKGYTDTAFAIRPESEVAMNLIYTIPELNYTKHAYANLEDEDLMLTVTMYPTMKMIKLHE